MKDYSFNLNQLIKIKNPDRIGENLKLNVL